MKHYHLYFLNNTDGNIATMETIDAADDAAAVGLVDPRTGRQPMELWREGYKVRSFSAAARAISKAQPSHEIARPAAF